MKTLFKIVAALIGVLVLLVIVAAVAVPMFFDPNDYRDEIVAKVKETTGRDLKIEGEIGLSVFPWIGADVGVVELGNAPGFSDPYFARVERVNVRVKLVPLLSRKVEMDTVTVHGLALNLAKDAAGKTNWDDLTQGGDEAGAKSGDSAGAGATGDGGGTQLAGFAIGGLDVKNAQLHWADAQSGQTMSVDRLDLEVGALSPREPVDLSLEADLSGEQIPGGKATVSLKGRVTADPATHAVTVEDLVLNVLELEVKGQLATTRDSVSGSLEVSEFNPKKLLEALGQAVPQTADADALTRLALSTKLSGSPEALKLEPIDITLDDTKLTGNLGVGGFDAKLPAVTFALQVDKIDADRYLPPPAEVGGAAPASAPAATPGAAASEGAGLPLDTLRALDVDGSLTIGELMVAKLTTTEVVVTIKAKDGLINLSPLGAKLYEGTYTGNVSLDARGDQPRLGVDEKITGVQAGPLLTDLIGKDTLEGTAEFSAKMTAVGADPEAMKRTLNGNAAVAFTNGVVNGINVARTIREFNAKLKGKTLPPSTEPLKTDFSEITASFVAKDGILTNQDLAAKSPLLRVEGAGTVDLPGDAIDYRPTVTVVATTKGQGGDDLQSLAGLPIPLKVSGSLAAPQYGVDYEKAAQVVMKAKGQEFIDGQLGNVAGGGAAGAAIGGLLGTKSDEEGAAAPSGGDDEKKEGAGSIGGAVKGLKGLLGN